MFCDYAEYLSFLLKSTSREMNTNILALGLQIDILKRTSTLFKRDCLEVFGYSDKIYILPSQNRIKHCDIFHLLCKPCTAHLPVHNPSRLGDTSVLVQNFASLALCGAFGSLEGDLSARHEILELLSRRLRRVRAF